MFKINLLFKKTWREREREREKGAGDLVLHCKCLSIEMKAKFLLPYLQLFLKVRERIFCTDRLRNDH